MCEGLIRGSGQSHTPVRSSHRQRAGEPFHVTGFEGPGQILLSNVRRVELALPPIAESFRLWKYPEVSEYWRTRSEEINASYRRSNASTLDFAVSISLLDKVAWLSHNGTM